MGDDFDSKRALAYPASRLGAPIQLVDLAAEIEQADRTLGTVVHAKLDVIREQIQKLQEQAREALEEARRSALLHRARCSFKKIPGRTYYLYRRGDDDLYFSMLSPEEWGGSPPHPFEGSYRLEADQTFTPAGSAPQRERPEDLIRGLL